MAKKKTEPITDPGVLIPAPAVAQADEVVVVLCDANRLPTREVAIATRSLGVTIVIDRQAYLHVANDAAGRWIFVPTT